VPIDEQVRPGLVGPTDGLGVRQDQVVHDQVAPAVAAVGLVDDLDLGLLALVGGQVDVLPVQ
jgi:hypothetical protein